MKYFLIKENKIDATIENKLEITEEEYNQTIRTIHKNRAETVQKLIKELAQAIGTSEAKTMIRETLREL